MINEKPLSSKISFEFDDEPLFSPVAKSTDFKTSEYRPSTAEKTASVPIFQPQASSAAKSDDDILGGGYVPTTMGGSSRRGLGLGTFSDDFFKADSKTAPSTTQLSTSPFASAFKVAADQGKKEDLKSSQKFNKSFEDLFESNLSSVNELLGGARKPAGNELNRTAPVNTTVKPQTSKSTERDLFSPTVDIFDSNKRDALNQNLRPPTATANMGLSATGRQRSVGLFEKPPLPASKDILFDIEPFAKPPASKESMNSSFADSVDNNEKMNNSIDPLGGKDQAASKDNDGNWFSSLVANKKVSKSSTVSTTSTLFPLRLQVWRKSAGLVNLVIRGKN